MRLHFRIRAKKSLADLEPELIEKKLSGLKGIELKRVIDDRIADGITLSVIIILTDQSNDAIARLQRSFISLPKVFVNIMDNDGKESDLSQMSIDEIRHFEIK